MLQYKNNLKKERQMAENKVKKDEQFSFKTTKATLEKGRADAEANGMSLGSYLSFLVNNAKITVTATGNK